MKTPSLDQNQGSLAKITPPAADDVVLRERLFRHIDYGRKRPIIWIAGPAGAGKTTLAASYLDARQLPCLWYQVDEGDGDIATFFYYLGLAARKSSRHKQKPLPLLTPEYLQDVPTFTRRYFEALFVRMESHSVLVFDNFQDAKKDAFYEVMSVGLEMVPKGVTVIILSRQEPPPQMVRLRANNKIHLLGWEDIRFTLEESEALVSRNSLQKVCMEGIYGKTDGWAAGLVLLLEMAKAKNFDYSAFDQVTPDEVFDYFAREVFSRTDLETQRFLLQTSVLPELLPAVAERLTGLAAAGQILSRLSKNNYFIHKHSSLHPVYQYHPLFREFLFSLARDAFDGDELNRLRTKAASLLEGSGKIEEAVRLYRDAGDFEGLIRVLLTHAQSLASEGRYKTLEEWILGLPEAMASENPWILFWQGVCRMASNPAGASVYFEKAYFGFKKSEDVAGLFLTWASLAETFLYEWGDFRPLDHWLREFDEIAARYPRIPSPEIEAKVASGMLKALTWRQPHHESLPLWAEKVKAIVLSHSSNQFRIMQGSHLILYYLWIGEFSQAGLLMDALRPISEAGENDPLTLQNWYFMEGMYAWMAADGRTCMEAVAKGIKNAEMSGIHLADMYLLSDGVYSGLSLGDPKAATACLKQMSGIKNSKPMDHALFHYQVSSVAWFEGDLIRAIEHGKLALKFADECGCPLAQAQCLIELAVALFDHGDHAKADRYLAQAKEVGRGMNNIEHLRLLHGARFAFERGNEKGGLDLLKQGLGLAARQGYVNMPCWNGKMMALLCEKALEYGIEPAYVRELIRKRGLIPEKPVAGWPFSVEINTLGRFEIIKDGSPIQSSGKVQKKPLLLLKTLIAQGGSLREEKLCDLLWPDAEGDAAHKALEITVIRLRKVLGSKEAVDHKGGSVALKKSLCWVDAWAFDELTAHAKAAQKRGEADEGLYEKARKLYKGPFLAGEPEAWMIPCRERLAKAFRQALQE